MLLKHLSQVLLILLLCGLFAGCAQVPKESVELSTTVGRDLTAAHKSHRELAKTLFARMKADIHRFVDNVYAPYQIRSAVAGDLAASRSSNPEERKSSLILGINNAFAPGASDAALKNIAIGMGYFVEDLRSDIESKRRELIEPIDKQEADLLAAIDRNYAQLIYANSIVTGYLSSIVKVHDAQSQILDSIGVDGDLTRDIASRLAETTQRVGDLVTKAEKVDASSESIKETVQKLKESVTRSLKK
jgi:hypothetical protein